MTQLYTPPYPAPPRKSRTWLIVLIVVAAVIALCCLSGIALVMIGGHRRFGGHEVTPLQSASPEPSPSPSPTRAPRPSEFELKVKVTDKQCFGTAGCLIRYDVGVTYAAGPMPEGSWRVTYKVTGDANGDQVHSFRVAGSDARGELAGSMRTKGDDVVPAAEVTDVTVD